MEHKEQTGYLMVEQSYYTYNFFQGENARSKDLVLDFGLLYIDPVP